MTSKNKRLAMGLGGFAVGGLAGYVVVSRLARGFEPYIRAKAIAYLQKRWSLSEAGARYFVDSWRTRFNCKSMI
jgi:hypothetical protein